MGGSALRAGLVVTAGNVLVNISNLGRDMAIAMSFGSSLAVDSFFLATMLPVFLLTVGTGAFRNTIVPLLERHAHFRGASSTKEIVGRLMANNLAIMLVVIGMIALSVHWYAPVVTGRLPDGSWRLVEIYTWAALPMFLLSGYASLAEGPLQSRGRFFLPCVARAGLPLGLALGAITLGGNYGIMGACLGGLLGASIQLAVTARLLFKEGFWESFWTPLDRETSETLRTQFIPLAAGVSFMYVSSIIDQWMASFLGAGSVSVLSYANRLIIGGTAIAAGAIGPALLPRFSRLCASADKEALNTLYMLVMKLTLWGGCLFAGVIWLFSEPTVVLLYERGSFVRADTAMVANIVECLALQFPILLPGIVSAALLSAANLNSFFMPLNLINALINVLGNWVLMQRYGLAGIAFSTVITYLISTLALNLVLYKKRIVSVQRSFSVDIFASAGIAILLSILIFALDAKPAAVPTLYQIVLSVLALSLYSAIAFYFLRPLTGVLLRRIWSSLNHCCSN